MVRDSADGDGMTSAADYANQMAAHRANKPRPIDKLYGRNGPTPEQRAEWDNKMREWNKTMRDLTKKQKAQLEIDNAEFRANRKWL